MRGRIIHIIALAAIVLIAAPAFASTAGTHTVRSGDTLWSIARRYGVSVDVLASVNRLANPDALQLGQRIVIPVPASLGRTERLRLPSRGAKWGSGLLAIVSRQVGVRYRWGGMSPRGFDCSGFIGYVMRAAGVSMPRTTYAMWAQGRPVRRDELSVGDIVFFNTTRPGPSHAGIFIGHNQFIHSSSGFGRVTVTSMDYRYYKPRYLGARRF